MEIEGVEDFPEVAEKILQKAIFHIKEYRFRIIEIEFYWHKEPEHPDPYVHCHSLQFKKNVFYFHPKAHPYAGLDIAVGNGGILLRGIEDLSTGEITDGPSLLVNRILRELPTAKTDFQGKNIFKNEDLFLDFTGDFRKEIFHSPRIGLSEKEPFYAKKLYRFLTEPRKTKKGRIEVIFGMRNLSIERIIQLTGSPRASVFRYLQIFEGKLDPRTSSEKYCHYLVS